MPSRVSSSGYASSRSQRITWTSNPARARVPASFAIRGSRPAGLFERTKTTRTAMSSQERGDLLRDLLPGRAVAEGVRPLPFRGELAADRGSDPRGVRPREDVRSDLQGLRTLRVLAQGDARHAEEATFLLESTGVRHHDRRFLLEDQHVQVARRVDASQGRQPGGPLLEPEFLQSLRGPRWDGEDDRHSRFLRGLLERLQGPRQLFLDVHVLRPVEGEEDVPTTGQAQSSEHVGLLLGDREVLDQRVDHAVPDDVDARRHVLLSKVLPRGTRRREADVRELVRDDPIHLLGQRLAEGRVPGLDVGQPPFLLLREESPRDGRVRVPVDDDEVRVLRDAGDLPHRRRDLQVRRLLLQLELLVRLPELHVPEEDTVHHEVVMLTGMHEDMFVVEAVQGLHDRGHLDDFRAGPDDRDDAAHRRRRASNRGPNLKIVPRGAQVETIITATRLRAALLVSVVTTVRNEARNIAALLDSLVVQEPPFEIIVVDSASQDATRDIVRHYERQYENVHLYIFGGTRGAGRNFGIREAKGEAVAFIDGDAIANPFLLKELREGLRRSDVVAGRTIQIGYRPFDETERVELIVQGTDVTYPSSNLAYRKSVLDEIGGFDRWFVTAEDIDLNIRAVRAGHTIAFRAGAIVYHRTRSSVYDFLRQALWNRAGRKQLTLKHRALWNRYRPGAMLRQKTNFWSLLRLNTALLGYVGYKFFGKPLPP